MNYEHFQPVPALRPYVECFWIIESSTGPGVIPRARMPADSRAILLMNFIGESRMIASAGVTHTVGLGAYLLGVHSESYVLEHDGDTDLFAVQFHPGGFASFMHYGASELAEETTSLDLLWGKAGNLLSEQIYEADTKIEKLAIYQNTLLQRYAEVPHQPRIRHALAQIEIFQGNTSVEWLAERTNLSQKHFERLFERVVGMMPKRYIRLARFQKLMSWLRRYDRTESWAALAAQFGYYDHSHLVKDFQAFAGTTPSEFAAATAGVLEVAYGNLDEFQEV